MNINPNKDHHDDKGYLTTVNVSETHKMHQTKQRKMTRKISFKMVSYLSSVP